MVRFTKTVTQNNVGQSKCSRNIEKLIYVANKSDVDF